MKSGERASVPNLMSIRGLALHPMRDEMRTCAGYPSARSTVAPILGTVRIRPGMTFGA